MYKLQIHKSNVQLHESFIWHAYHTCAAELDATNYHYGHVSVGTRPDPNGAQSFWATAPAGSWQINLPLAGHMSFLDYDPATDPGQPIAGTPLC